jgi:hypothetical protein
MTSSRVGNSVAVASLDLFAWDTRSQENDFTASVRDGAGTCVSGDSAQNHRHSTGNSAGALRASHAGRGRPSPPWRAAAPTAPSPLHPRDWSPNAGPKRCVSGDGERSRKESARALGGFKLRAEWTKP